MPKKVAKDITDLVSANVGVGIGTGVVAGAGGNTAGLAPVGRLMPAVGIGVMGKNVLRLTRNLQPKKAKKKRK